MNGKKLTPILISGVSCYEQNGTAYLRLEDVARGLGFTRTAASGNEVVMWSRVDSYLSDLGVHTCAHDGFIPENIFYRLAMKAKNETAEKFQALVADEIIPSIRKTGGYTAKPISRSELMAQALIAAHEELEEKDKRIAELTPDAEFARAVCVGKNCRTTTSLSKDYGLSAEKLNSILHGLKIQYKTSDGQWVLYTKYCGKGYTKNRKSTPFQHKSTGKWETKNTTVWTEAGQRFIYEQLKAIGLLPKLDSKEVEA